MIPIFNFIGFDPDDDTKAKAYISVDKLLDISPFDSRIVALLQKDDISFRCAIEIYSKHGPFIARASDANPIHALESVVESLSKKLKGWQNSRRFSERTKITPPMTSVA